MARNTVGIDSFMSDGGRRTVSEVREKVRRELIPTVPEDELQRRICERFAESADYAFAWIGRYSPDEGRVTPRAAAGIGVDALEAVSLDDESPRRRAVGRAVETRDVQVEHALRDDPPDEDWGDHADAHDYQSMAVVPLVHNDAVYGVLVVAATDPDAFDADEQAALATLGESVAYALEDAASPAESKSGRELEQYKTVVESVNDGVYVADRDGNFAMVNEAYADMLGYAQEELVGSDTTKVVDDSIVELVEAELAKTDGGDIESPGVEAELQTAGGNRLPVRATFATIPGESGSDWHRIGVVRDVTEQKQHERELEQHETVAETASDVIVSIDERSRVQSVNPAVEDIFGYTPEELIGEPLTALMPESLRDQHREAIQRYLRTGERTLDWEYLELPGEHRDGHEIPLGVSFSEYEHEGEQYFTGILRDITERKQFEQALTNLHDVSRDLVQAENKSDVGRRTVDAATELLGLDGVVVYLFDDSRNALRPVATTSYLEDVLEGELPTFTAEDTAITWEAFINGETLTHDDILESDDAHRRNTPLRSGIWVPLSDHGVLAILSERVGEFDGQTEQLADHLAATAEATLDRVEREESLRDQERELEERNQQLQNLNRTNDIIRDIDQALVEATTREAIEQAVCGLLTRDERFAFAWIGDAGDEAVTPRTWAGDDQGYLDAVSLTADGDGDPSVTTASTGTATLVSNVASNLRNAPWRKAALARDLQSVISIPLQYNEVDYGVLTVYATRPDAFDELSQAILGELSETIANAMNFVDTRRALLADRVVELELAIHDADDPLVQIARDTGCQFEFQGIVPQAAGTARVFVEASGASADAVRTAAAASTRVENVTLLGGGDGGRSEDSGDEGSDDSGVEHGETRFEIELVGATIPSTLVECGAIVQTIQITATQTNVAVELPHSVDVRTFVDRLEEWYPDTELVARRDRERNDQTREAFEAALTERLTQRQLETLQTAYHSGYFEWPRDRTGEEVADNLDITQPTFNGHLRSAERKLLAMLFAGASAPPD